MVAIPPAKDSDAEDVVWGLQTAEALWKRGERIDAIVWLRRAAQAAGEAADDDRALELARSAAELSDWMATQPPGTTLAPPATSSPDPAPPKYDPHNAATFVPFGDEEQRTAEARLLVNNAPTYIPQAPTRAATEGSVLEAPRPVPPLSRPASSPTIQTAEPQFAPVDGLAASGDATPIPASFQPGIDAAALAPGVTTLDEPGHDDVQGRGETASVLPAEHVHAGMFNPWDDGARPSSPSPSPSPPVALPPPPVPVPLPQEEEEVITSLPAGQLVQPRADASAAGPAVTAPAASAPRPLGVDAPRPPQPAPSSPAGSLRPSPPRPPPLPPRARKPPPPVPSAPSMRAAPLAPSVPVSRPAPPPRVTPAPPSPTQVMPQPSSRPDAQPLSERTDPGGSTAQPRPVEAPAAAPPSKLDLESVDAFSDLPDDARAAFAAAAEVSVLGEGEEVSSFALAYILSGTVDVAATMVDAPAARLAAGAVLRSRGTTDEGVPMRLIGVSSGVVATWTDAEVDEAFRTCPWVENDLRTAADRLQTLVGVTIGPLGERLDASIREEIIGRLTMRTLTAGEIVVTAGEQMPGLLLVGVGELELVSGEKVAGTVGSGEFLFPTEVLGGGDAPHTARAGAGGALILFGDRHIAQELLVTCPPLLEVFAGM